MRTPKIPASLTVIRRSGAFLIEYYTFSKYFRYDYINLANGNPWPWPPGSDYAIDPAMVDKCEASMVIVIIIMRFSPQWQHSLLQAFTELPVVSLIISIDALFSTEDGPLPFESFIKIIT